MTKRLSSGFIVLIVALVIVVVLNGHLNEFTRYKSNRSFNFHEKKDSMRVRNMEKFLILNHEIFSFNYLLLRV